MKRLTWSEFLECPSGVIFADFTHPGHSDNLRIKGETCENCPDKNDNSRGFYHCELLPQSCYDPPSYTSIFGRWAWWHSESSDAADGFYVYERADIDSLISVLRIAIPLEAS